MCRDLHKVGIARLPAVGVAAATNHSAEAPGRWPNRPHRSRQVALSPARSVELHE